MVKKSIIFLIALFIFQSSFTQITLLNEIYTKNHDITSLAYSNDGNLYATAGYDQTIIIRNTRDEIVKRITGHKDLIRSLAFSTDNNFIVGGGEKKIVYVWNIQSGILTFTLKGHKKVINAISISSNNIIASGSEDKTIKLWDLSSGNLYKTLENNEDEISSLDFANNQSILASGSLDGIVNIWDVSTGALIKTFKDSDKRTGEITCVRFSPDGKTIVVSDTKSKIIFWNYATGLKIKQIELEGAEVISMAYTPDNRYLVTGSKSGNFVIWNTDNYTKLFESFNTKNAINAISIDPKGEKVLTADFTANLSIWDIKALGIVQALNERNHDNNKNETRKEEKTNLVLNIPNSDIDINIPEKCKEKNKSKYALIIGNEDYNSHQLGLNAEVNVDYAVNDAIAFSNYVQNVFCIPTENVFLLKNANAVEMHRAIEKINLLTEIYSKEIEIYFYFAGHGFPDEVTKEPYIMPVDVSGKDLKFAINIKDLYTKLTEHSPKQVTVFLDACFSGGARNQGLLTARGVKIVPKKEALLGNLVVFTASRGQESSLPYHKKKHGLFTYFLLKKIQETKGNITYGELSEYLNTEVARQSILINDKPQNPQTNVSPSIQNKWKNIEF